jgi:GGDEF domain-containing protein
MEGAKALEDLKGEKISVSMGHAFWSPGGSETIDEILKTADMTMLENKRKKARTP